LGKSCNPVIPAYFETPFSWRGFPAFEGATSLSSSFSTILLTKSGIRGYPAGRLLLAQCDFAFVIAQTAACAAKAFNRPSG